MVKGHAPWGNRLVGWEELNCDRLAREMGMSTPQHLRDVLSGRAKGSIDMLIKTAAVLELDMTKLLARIVESKRRRESAVR